MNVRALLRAHGQAAGVFLPSMALTCLWGLSGIGYYLDRHDHLSVVGCVFRDAGTFTWLGIALWHRHRGQKPRDISPRQEPPSRAA